MEDVHIFKVQQKLIHLKLETIQGKLIQGKTEINTEAESYSGHEK